MIGLSQETGEAGPLGAGDGAGVIVAAAEVAGTGADVGASVGKAVDASGAGAGAIVVGASEFGISVVVAGTGDGAGVVVAAAAVVATSVVVLGAVVVVVTVVLVTRTPLTVMVPSRTDAISAIAFNLFATSISSSFEDPWRSPIIALATVASAAWMHASTATLPGFSATSMSSVLALTD